MARPTNAEDAAAKERFMLAFFDEAEARIAFLNELVKTDHYQEALTLCLTYVDSFANWLFWPRQGVGLNFVEALSTYEQSPYLALIHPLQLVRATAVMKGEWKARSTRVAAVLTGPPWVLQPRSEFLSSIRALLPVADVTHLERELWRGTLANIGYQYLRNPSVHSFGSASSIGFSDTYYEGKWAGLFGIDRLIPPLRAMVAEARRRSVDACQWFGNDAIILGDS